MLNIRPESDLRSEFPETELALDEADRAAATTDIRYSAPDVFAHVRKGLHDPQNDFREHL